MRIVFNRSKNKTIKGHHIKYNISRKKLEQNKCSKMTFFETQYSSTKTNSGCRPRRLVSTGPRKETVM